MNRLPRFIGVLAAAWVATLAAALAQAVTVTITPSAISLVPGQSAQFSAHVQGAPPQSRLMWSLRGPRDPGADWGRITNAGQYTAPLRPPSGQVFVTATVLGRFGEPVGSASVPVNLGRGVQPPVAAPLPPPVAAPPPPPIQPPPRVVAPPPPPKLPPPAPKPAVMPPPIVPPPPTAGSPAQVINHINQGRALCQRNQAMQGLAQWTQAAAIWDGLAQSARLQAVQQLVSQQLADSSTRVVVDPAVFNYARVTADAGGTRMTLSGNLTPPGSTPFYRTLLDVPLIRDPQLAGIGSGRPYRTLVHFICYETEVARIRSMIQGRCVRIGGMLRGAIQNAMRDGRLSRTEYEQMMAPWSNAPLADRLAASWMIERIAADPNPNPSSCDLPLSITQLKPDGSLDDYRTRIAGDISFFHDVRATAEGARRCGCQ